MTLEGAGRLAVGWAFGVASQGMAGLKPHLANCRSVGPVAQESELPSDVASTRSIVLVEHDQILSARCLKRTKSWGLEGETEKPLKRRSLQGDHLWFAWFKRF